MGPKNRCLVPLTQDCAEATEMWQTAIDTVVLKNFPEEWGRYQAVVWEDTFDNAWVVKGSEINITRQFLYKMNDTARLCVAAHELAHLKLGHYYARVGIIIVESPVRNESGGQSIDAGHYGGSTRVPIPKGFGRKQEEEADRLAMEYIHRAGVNRRNYLNLLFWLQKGASGFESSLARRIKSAEFFLDKHN